MGKDRADIAQFTALRGFASIWVFGYHFKQYIVSLEPNLTRVMRIFDFGYLGVDIFFILSGFILAHTYSNKIDVTASTFRLEVKNYFLKRVARIMPIYILTTVAALLLNIYAAKENLRVSYTNPEYLNTINISLNFAGLQQWLDRPSFNGPSWSVSCEIAVYIFFPLLISLVTIVHKKRFLAFHFLFFVFAYILYLLPLFVKHHSFNINPRMLQCFSEFSMGVLLREFAPSYRIRQSHRTITLFGLVTLFVLLFYSRRFYQLGFLATPLLVILLILVIYLSNHSKSFFLSKIWIPLGLWSYSLYLSHGIWQSVLELSDIRSIKNLLFFRFAQIFLLLSLPIFTAGLLYRFVENPLRRKIVAYCS